MKIKNLILLLLKTLFASFALFCITGCIGTPKIIPYSLMPENETENPVSANMIFVRLNASGSNTDKWYGVRLLECEGIELPVPENKDYWQQVTLPAGRQLNLRVFIFYFYEDYVGKRYRGVFKCPPLEAGRSYKLWNLGNRQLILTDASVDKLRYSVSGFGKEAKPQFEIIYEQKISSILK